MKRRPALPLALVAMTSLTGCGSLVHATRDFALTAPWQNYARVAVRSHNGSIDLATAGVADIEISGTKRAGGLTLSEARENLEQLTVIAEPDAGDASTFVIELKFPDPAKSRNLGADFLIRLPVPCAAKVQTDNGSIVVHDLKEQVDLATTNGDIDVAGVAGDVHAGNTNGRVIAQNVAGNLTAESSNGTIIAKTIGGDCRLQTTNGAIQIQAAQGDIEAATSNGDVRVVATPPEDAVISLHASNGSIQATLPPNLKADLELRTSNGQVRASVDNIPLLVKLWEKEHVKAKMNGGGSGRVVAITANGSITLDFR